MALENTPCVVDLWESSYTKGEFEKVTVGDLKQFAQVVDQVNAQQNTQINSNMDAIASNKSIINTLQSQISELQSEINALKGANK